MLQRRQRCKLLVTGRNGSKVFPRHPRQIDDGNAAVRAGQLNGIRHNAAKPVCRTTVSSRIVRAERKHPSLLAKRLNDAFPLAFLVGPDYSQWRHEHVAVTVRSVIEGCGEA